MRVHLINFVLFTLLCVASSAGFAQTEPNFPALNGRVVDQAGLLDATTKSALTEQLAAHEAETSNQVVVVTVNSLDGLDEADYALKLGREWGIGTEENNNGVVFLVAPNERKVRIEVGYGLEGAIPDGLAGQIIDRNILPSFKEDDYSNGIQSGVKAILQAAVGEYKAKPMNSNRPTSGTDKSVDFIPLFFIAMVAVPALLRNRGLKRVANASFPGGFAGLAATVLSGNLIVGIIIGLAAFAAMYFLNPSTGSGGSGRGGRSPRGGFGGGGGFSGGGGGGFSGGGGSFGGGGASGSW